MSTTIARFQKGNLLLAGNIDERLPAVVDGLVSYFPLDGVSNGINYNCNIKVENGTITDLGNVTILSTSSVTTANNVINFTGAIDSWVKLLSTPFNNATDFIIEVGFCVNTISGIATVFHLANSGGNQLSLVIQSDKSVTTDFKGSNKVWFSAGTCVLGQYYIFKLIRTSGVMTAELNGVQSSLIINDSNALVVTSGVLGQEQDADYGSFDASQSLNGYISYFRFMTPIIPSSNINNTLTSSGLSVEEATTNLWNGKTTTASNGSWSVVNNPYPDYDIDNTIIQCTPRSYMNYYTISNSDSINYPTGTIFTISAMVYVEYNCDSMGPIRICGESVTTGTVSYDMTKKGTWQYMQFTVTSTGNGFYFLLYANSGTGSNTWTKGNVYYANVQVEKKSFATSYVDGNRSSGIFKIPVTSSLIQEGTVVFKAKLDNVSSTNERYLTFQWSPTGNSAGHWGVLLLANNTFLCQYSGNNFSSPVQSIDTNFHTYIWSYKYNGNSKLYIDGVKIIDSLITATQDDYNRKDGVIPVGHRGWSYNDLPWNGIISMFSMYNRQLTDDEALKLSKQSLSIDKNGNMTNFIEEGNNIGDGKSGSLTVTVANTVINKYAYATTNINYNATTSGILDDVSNFNVGDEILIIQMQHNNVYQVGTYEFNRIDSIDTTNKIITFSFSVQGNYYSGTYNTSSSLVTQIIKVPNYSSVTINASSSLTCDTWNGQKGGILAFRCLGDVVNNGSIDVTGKGYRGGRVSGQDGYTDGYDGGSAGADGECGEGYTGRGKSGFYSGYQPVVKDGGGTTYVNGCGGSYATSGGTADPFGGYQSLPGLLYGHASLCNWYLGSGGGGGHNNSSGTPHGGNGGGCILIFAKSVSGIINSKGQDAYFNTTRGDWGAGGGSGGSIYIECETFTGTTDVSGGLKNTGINIAGNGGNGGLGYTLVNIREGINQVMSIRKDKVIVRGNLIESQIL